MTATWLSFALIAAYGQDRERPLLLVLAVIGVPLYFLTDWWPPILFLVTLVGVVAGRVTR